MPKKRHTLDPADVVTITRDTEELDEIVVRWDEDGEPLVKAMYIVPDKDGTLRHATRVSNVSPTGFITSVFNDTKR